MQKGNKLPINRVKWIKTDVLPETERQEKGFGITGNT